MDENTANKRAEVRAAAYLATKERLDFRRGKTRALVQCNPPNVKCGNRCIPPEWDCRLKGQGSDAHLAARRTDPISGFANIERGVRRLGRFARTGSFSELESGKRSLVRGAVKLKPGNLKEKNEFKDWLENNYLKIAVPLFVVGGAISAHSILKGGDIGGYRKGAGKKIDDAVANGISRILDTTPGIGQSRAYTRQQASQAMQRNLKRIQNREQRNRGFVRTPENYIGSTEISPTLIKGRSDLNDALLAINEQKAANNFYQWNQKHNQAFWGATHNKKSLTIDDEVLIGKSVFAEPTAQSYLNNEWNLNLPSKAARSEYINALTNRIAIERDAYVQLAKQQGFKVQGRPGEQYIHRDDIDAFVTRNIQGITNEGQRRAQSAFINAIARQGAASTKARDIYNGHVDAYDKYYRKVASSVARVAGASDTDADMVAEGLVAIRKAAQRRRIDYLMIASKKPRKSSAGPAHDRLFLLDYYHTSVVGSKSSKYPITVDEAIKAATELSGNTVRTGQEAITLLNTSHGFKGAYLLERRNPFSRKGTAPAPEGGRPARRRTPAQQIAAMMRQKNPDGTPRYASREAAQAEYERRRAQYGNRDDEEQHFTPRITAYLDTIARLDKRCGKSGISEKAKCTKNTPVQSEEAANRAKGAAQPGLTCFPPNQKCGNLCIPPTSTCHLKGGGEGFGSKVAKGVLAVGLAAGGVAAYKNRKAIGKAARVVGNTVKAERGAYKQLVAQKMQQKNSYGGQKYTQRSAERAAFQEYRASREAALRQVYEREAPKYYNEAIKLLSTKEVSKRIDALPNQFKEPARKLTGKAKAGLAVLSAEARGFELRKVNNDSNFSVFSTKDGGKTISIGSVGDTLVTFNADRDIKGRIDIRTENGRGMDTYDIQFMTDLSFKQKEGVSKADSTQIASMLKSMNQDSIATLPQNALLRNIPFADDGLGRKRGAIYKRFGYKSLKGLRGNAMFATLSNGEVVPIAPEYEDFYADLIKGDSYEEAAEKFTARSRRDTESDVPVRVDTYLRTKQLLDERFDKKCGKSATADKNKCSKPVAQRVGEALAVGAGAAAVVGGAAYLLSRKPKGGNASRAYRPTSNNQAANSTVPFPQGKTSKDWFELPKTPGVTEGSRVRKYTSNLEFEPVNSKDFSNSVASVVGNTAEGKLVSQVIRKHKISIDSNVLEQIKNSPNIDDLNRKAVDQLTQQLETIPMLEGAFIDPNFSGFNGVPPANKVWVNHRRDSKTEFNPSAEGVKKSINEYLSARSRSLSSDEISALGESATSTQIEDFSKTFVTYNNAEKDDRDFIIALHESAHALDVGFARRNKPPVTDEATFQKQASTVVSHYGMTDIGGSKDEFFAESTVLYALAPETLKKKAPLVYDWVDSYLKAIDSRL